MMARPDKAVADEERALQLFERQRASQTAAAPLPAERDCIDCGFRIPAARVAAVPRALRCYRCQGEVEAR